MAQVRITSLPEKIHLAELQAEMDAALGESIPLMGQLDPDTGITRALIVQLPDNVDIMQVEAVVAKHAPTQSDVEEIAEKSAEPAIRREKVDDVLARFEDLVDRVEALERGSRR